MTNDTRIERWRAMMGGLAVLGVALLLPATAHAQEPPPEAPSQFHACYVPSSGVTYRIKEPGLRDACSGKKHVEFTTEIRSLER